MQKKNINNNIIVIHPDNASLERITAYTNALISYLKRKTNLIPTTEISACISNVNARSGIYKPLKTGKRGRPPRAYTGKYYEDCTMPHIHLICKSGHMNTLDKLVRIHATNYFHGLVDVRRIDAGDYWSKELVYIKKQTIKERHLVT